MSVWLPLTVKHVCAAQSPRSRLHAVETVVAMRTRKDPVHRTVCGLDARFAGGHDLDGAGMVAPWPPPIEDRCVDCARLTGVGGRQRAGDRWWHPVVAS